MYMTVSLIGKKAAKINHSEALFIEFSLSGDLVNFNRLEAIWIC